MRQCGLLCETLREGGFPHVACFPAGVQLPIDGSPVVCISRPGFREAKPVNLQQLQSGYVDRISKDPRNRTAFLVTIRYGNGSNLPTTQYRLNLSAPNQPRLTILRSWKS
ncbi:hypothetical protein [Nostoc sp. CMAA1605]|uniref:hypothetical protein n=1 Tax=Nostoc sp. CMAA1605 TaxID=2055159 RepID=UPI001F1D4120|nr:hypothetical protein [Nostoc sp. CMAA1605]MCF4967986.1 hypothetical protein [Nostoc sp. CMAA1605]